MTANVYEASLRYFLRPIGGLLADETVTEVMVNGCGKIYIERGGRIEPTDARFDSEDALRSAVNNLAQAVGREIDEDRPVLDARLPDGSRVHAVIPPSARGGTFLNIRKFSRAPLTMQRLVELGSLSPAAREFLEICVRLRKNVLISGGAGSGKTSLLGALTAAIPAEERIIVIEDVTELRLQQPHCLHLEVQPATCFGRPPLDVRELFRATLRMRPDRILVGEVRGGEALDLVQAMISGHAGSLSTVHADSPYDALLRLETLMLMSNVDLPAAIARRQATAAIDLVVHVTRAPADGARRVARIAEVLELNAAGEYELRDLFAWRPSRDEQANGRYCRLEPTGERPSFASEAYDHGLSALIERSQSLWSEQP